MPLPVTAVRCARYTPSVRPRDTDRTAHEIQLACYRRMTGAERVAVAAQLSDDVRAIAAAGIRARHPGYSERDVWFALQRLLLGDELFGRAWPAGPRLAP